MDNSHALARGSNTGNGASLDGSGVGGKPKETPTTRATLESVNTNLALLATEIREAQRSQSDTFSQTLGVLKSLLMDRQSSSEALTRPCAEAETRGDGPSTSGIAANRANANSSNASRKRQSTSRVTHDMSDSGDENTGDRYVLPSNQPGARHSGSDSDTPMDLDGDIQDVLRSVAGDAPDSGSTAEVDDLLGDYSQALHLDDKVGDEIQTPLANLLTNLLSKKLDEAALNKKADLYPRPANVPEIVTPAINTEIWGQLQKPTRSRDIKFQKAQGSNVKGLSALARLANTLLEAKNKKTSVSVPDCLKLCLDAFALFSNGNQEMNHRRKESIKPDLNIKFKDLAKNNPVPDKLFGDDLSQQVKDINETAKMSKDMSRANRSSFTNSRTRGHHSATKNWGDSRRYQSGRNPQYNNAYNTYNRFQPSVNRKFQGNGGNRGMKRTKFGSQK